MPATANAAECTACPEKSRSRDTVTLDMAILQKGDVWSLGCVFSEVATWLILGRMGVSRYRKVRQQESGRDDFHDGYSVKPIVTAWHHYLLSICRRSDPYTWKVLDLV